MDNKDSEFYKLQNDDNCVAVICKDMDKTQLPSAKKPLGERRKAVLRQRLMVILGNTGVIGAGMAVALPSATLGSLTDPTESFFLNNSEASWYSSINTMACPIGGIIVGYALDKLGRKFTILITNITGIIGWGLLWTATLHEDREAIYWQILVGRFFSGLMIGLCLSPIGVYSAEISLPKIRGRLILCTSISIAAGILLMYVLGYFIRHDWRLIVGISCVYQIFSAICVLPMPESPSWLMQRGSTDRARKSLKYFRGLQKNDISYCDEFETEFAQIRKNTEISQNTAAVENSMWTTFKAPEVYKPLLLMIGFFAFQQFSGVVVVVVFAVQIASQAGVSWDPVLCAVFVGIARITTTFFMSNVFERWGRKPAGITSAIGMAICMLSLAICGWYPIGETLPLLPIVSLVFYIIFSTMGLLTLPFFLISEVFPQRVRGSASGITVCFGLLISFVVVKMYSSTEEEFGISNMFAFFGFVSLVAAFYIYYLVPETRGRTLLEIEEYFRTGKVSSDDEITLRNDQLP